MMLLLVPFSAKNIPDTRTIHCHIDNATMCAGLIGVVYEVSLEAVFTRLAEVSLEF